MFRISPKLAGVAALLLLSILPALAQKYAPINRGAPPPPCSVGPYYYNQKGDKPPPVYDPTEKYLMKRADTGAARSALSFQPNSVRIVQGDPIVFTPEIGWPANGRLTGDLYAIYSPAGPLNHDMYLMPVAESGLPTASGPVNAVINPLNYYFHDGAGPKPNPAPPIPSTIVRLSNGQLDTDDMPLGQYWFTVQSAIQYPDGGGTCHKTSSMVRIEIVEPIEYDLKVDVAGTDGSCDTKSMPSATATLALKNISERDVEIRWTVTHSDGNPVDFEPRVGSKSVRVIRPRKGVYTFKAAAEWTKNRNIRDDDSADVRYIDCIEPRVQAAGLVYFRFAVPDAKKRHLIPDSSAPETWSGGSYPSEHLGFSKDLDFDAGTAVETNSAALERIIARLEADKSLYLRIYGFADFKRTKCYDNYALGERRARMVYNYIVSRLGRDIEGRLSMDVTGTMGDGSVSTRDPNDQADRRLWDRRVEIYYTTDPVLLEPGKRPVQSCPAQRRGRKTRRR